MATKTKTQNGYVSPKTARLREVSGHNGPWSSAEYDAAIGTIVPDRERPDPPAEVADLAEARDVALAAFERADHAWRDAHATEAKAHNNGHVRISNIGELLNDPGSSRKLRNAEQKAEDAREQRDIAAAELKRITIRWRAADHAWRRRLITDAYEANKR